MIHAILLESNPDFTLMLPCACEGVGIHLTVVSTLEAVQRATRRAGPDDFVISDLSLDLPADKDRCAEVAGHSDLDVHIIYKPGAPDHAAFVRHMEQVGRGDLTWLPATVGLVELLDALRSLQKAALARRTRAKPLSSRQEDVLALYNGPLCQDTGEGQFKVETSPFPRRLAGLCTSLMGTGVTVGAK